MSDRPADRGETPRDEREVIQREPPDAAAGLSAVRTSLGRLRREARPGAIKALFAMNQKGGFDCPGCAWPDPDDRRSMLGEYCENGVKALVEEASANRADPDFFARHSVAEMREWDDHRLGKSGRITAPLYLGPGADRYAPVSWDDALERIGARLRSLADPNRAVFYTSGRTSNEAAFLYQLFVRMLGTNNLPDCSNMCHESSGVALAETLGIGKGSVTLEDFDHAELILIAGQNPGTNHPRMLNALERAKRRGARIIAINPLREPGLVRFKNPQRVAGLVGAGVDIADLYLQLRTGRDIALAKAIMLRLVQWQQEGRRAVDVGFIEASTTGFEALRADLLTYDFAALCAEAGLEPPVVERAASWVGDAERIICCWAMGLTQHEYAVRTIREYVNLLLMRGSIGKRGAGTCPVRGHSNVQGDRTMGIWEKASPEFLNRLEEAFGFTAPREDGYDTVGAIAAMIDRRVDVFFAMGGNFLSASPDTRRTAEGLQACGMTVHVSTKLNRSHLIHGDEALILPCTGRSEIDRQRTGEQIVSAENSMGVVQSSSGRLEPVSPSLRSEVAIVAALGTATFRGERSGADGGLDWDALAADYDRIRDRVEQVVPGFEDYNLRLREPGGFSLPNGAREGRFHTETGRARFTLNRLPEIDQREDEFLLMTIRSHDQFNTTIYGHDDRYRGLAGNRRVVMANPEDLAELGLTSRSKVHLESRFRDAVRRSEDWTVVAYDIPRRCLAAYYPEANVLVPLEQIAEGSRTPASKQITTRVIPAP
ncbi:MAG: FdhF/YdeP family oxidoreductase [Thermoleophilia bacterium]|nr:FdhF/YdeP family oxidoreductase [Thermoleophilia bacterium]MDH3724862.1 FdhF/YdeP family oxidoreductase [Thermoleophilia bacterium]